MRLRIAGDTRRGDAVDLRGSDADLPTVLDALASDLDRDDPLATVTPDPPPLTDALAAAARERGREHPNDDEIARLRDELEATGTADTEAVSADLSAARERAAEIGSDVARLRERTATLRGRLRARRGTDTEDSVGAEGAEGAERAAAVTDTNEPSSLAELESAFESATRALTEAETERVAAEQALDRASERARRVRDARERRLSLRDDLANRRREARADLARTMWAEFDEALGAVAAVAGRSPADECLGDGPAAFGGDPVAGHLAAVRLADREEPVVVSLPRFADERSATTATALRARLRAPVVVLSP